MTGVPALASIKNRLYGSCSHFGGWHGRKCCCWRRSSLAAHTHPSEGAALQTASVITNGYYLDVFFKPLFIRGKVCWARTSSLQQCPALHPKWLHTFRCASCPVQWAFLYWPPSPSRCNRSAVITVKPHQIQHWCVYVCVYSQLWHPPPQGILITPQNACNSVFSNK